MTVGRLLDEVLICDRRLVVASLVAGLALTSCAPEGNSVAGRVQSVADWMNNTPPAPAVPEWRLSKRPGLENAPYPKLSDVPPRPANLPTPASTQATVDTLKRDNAKTGTETEDRATGVALGGPKPAKIAPLEIPGVGVVGKYGVR